MNRHEIERSIDSLKTTRLGTGTVALIGCGAAVCFILDIPDVVEPIRYAGIVGGALGAAGSAHVWQEAHRQINRFREALTEDSE